MAHKPTITLVEKTAPKRRKERLSDVIGQKTYVVTKGTLRLGDPELATRRAEAQMQAKARL